MRLGIFALVVSACAPRAVHRHADVPSPEQRVIRVDPTTQESLPVSPAMSPAPATESAGIVVLDEMAGVAPEDQRWPLTRPPANDPSYPLTSAFDDAREPWITLCESRKDARKRDVLEYLESWCKLRVGQPTDRDRSLLALARLVDSAVVGTAVRDDLISVLAERDAISALHWLRDQRLETIAMLERLAATYVERDRADDALRVIELLAERDPNPATATQCRRLRRHMRIVPWSERATLQQQLLELRREDGTCERLAAALATGTSATGSSATVSLKWPQAYTSFDSSWQIATQANQARPRPGADQIMTDALEHAARFSGCDPDRLGNIRLLAAAVRSTDNHPASLNTRLDVLADLGPLECKQYVTASP